MKRVTLGVLALIAASFAGVASAGDFAPDFVAVPEPGTLGLLAAGVAAVVVTRLRGRK